MFIRKMKRWFNRCPVPGCRNQGTEEHRGWCPYCDKAFLRLMRNGKLNPEMPLRHVRVFSDIYQRLDELGMEVPE